MQIDPLADDYASYTPYNYVMNNPLIMTDPTGMSADTARIQAQDGSWKVVDEGSRTNMWVFNTGLVATQDNKTGDVVIGQLSDASKLDDDGERGGIHLTSEDKKTGEDPELPDGDASNFVDLPAKSAGYFDAAKILLGKAESKKQRDPVADSITHENFLNYGPTRDDTVDVKGQPYKVKIYYGKDGKKRSDVKKIENNE